jgi:hypothetical protein
MKLILVIADAARLAAYRGVLRDLRAPGYTALPVVEGAGRTGLHAGDRVHPGGLVAVVVIDEDPAAVRTFESLVAKRDADGDRVTRLFLLPVERQA